MKNTLILSFVFIVALISCGPAAENRQLMHERAKIFQDSIATFIKTSMDEAAAPGPNAAPVMVQPTAAAVQSAQPQAVSPNTGVNQTPGQTQTK